MSKDVPSVEPLISSGELSKILGLSPRGIRELVRVKKFPEPVRLGSRSIRWRRSDVLRRLGIEEGQTV